MEIVHGDKDLERYMREAVKVSEKSPVLLDRFLDDAIEVDVDCISDGTEGDDRRHHGARRAGRHPLGRLGLFAAHRIRCRSRCRTNCGARPLLMAKALKVVGLMNVQFAIQGEGDEAVVYVLEVNPRASRTVPFVSKATGQPLAKIAARCMVGQKLCGPEGSKRGACHTR